MRIASTACQRRCVAADARRKRQPAVQLLASRPNVKAAAQHTETTTSTSQSTRELEPIKFMGVHHVAFLCDDLQRSLKFYQDVLGLEINPDRPDDKLPYKGSWLWVGPDMLHLMEVPNPDPKEGRPEHGGRDRHFCTGVPDVSPLIARLDAAGIKYTMSKSGRRAVFFRDPDVNTIEVFETEPWR